jgi:uncharacterized membrane protein YfcA
MQFQFLEFFLIAVLGCVSGLMIGCIGIGGVILVPALVFLGGIPIQIGIPAAMLAYILPGLVATSVFARHKSIEWSMGGLLCAAATPTAFAGAWAVSALNPRWLEVGLGLLTFFSGMNALRTPHAEHLPKHGLSGTAMTAIGGFTGFASSVTGTGGPLVLVPILVAASLPVLTAVGLSQIIQVPIAIAATDGNVLYGKLDLTLAATLAVSLTVGSWFGAKLAHSVPRHTLRRIVSIVLVAVGIFILLNVIWRLTP